jgi:hypothetical protein
MRSSLLSRSVIAAASLAIGSVALAAVPATAATPTGVTREAVLSLASAARAGTVDPAAANDVLTKECGLETGESFGTTFAPQVTTITPVAVVEGVIVTGTVVVADAPTRECVVGLVAPKDPNTQLSGTANLSVTSPIPPAAAPPQQTTVSGDVSATTIRDAAPGFIISGASYAANGSATTTTSVTETVKVKDTKSKAQKKAAKKKYDKRVKAAKKAYKKALGKAGSSKSKKSAAKKVYKAKRASAKAKYKRAIAGYRLVTRTRPVTTTRSFSVTVQQSLTN